MASSMSEKDSEPFLRRVMPLPFAFTFQFRLIRCCRDKQSRGFFVDETERPFARGWEPRSTSTIRPLQTCGSLY